MTDFVSPFRMIPINSSFFHTAVPMVSMKAHSMSTSWASPAPLFCRITPICTIPLPSGMYWTFLMMTTSGGSGGGSHIVIEVTMPFSIANSMPFLLYSGIRRLITRENFSNTFQVLPRKYFLLAICSYYNVWNYDRAKIYRECTNGIFHLGVENKILFCDLAYRNFRL